MLEIIIQKCIKFRSYNTRKLTNKEEINSKYLKNV